MTGPTTVLVLGGTTEARELAERLVDRTDDPADSYGLRVVTSLAGRLEDPRLPAGEVRSGGFGGVDALAAWLRAHAPVVVVDATHPFATRISDHALAAAATTGTPLLRLTRPGWVARPGDRWLRVPHVAAAADLLPTLGIRPLLTTGRRDLAAFIEHPSCGRLDLLVRCVEHPTVSLPLGVTVLVDRGPFTLAGERALMADRGVDVLVTRDSGGESTRAKLDAAHELGLPVVMVDRPPPPPPPAAVPTLLTVPTVSTVEEAERWVLDSLGQLQAWTPRDRMARP